MDITEEKEAERSIAKTNALLKSLFEASPVGMAVFGRDHRFMLINKALAEQNGLPVDDHIGKYPHELLPELDDLQKVYEQWDNVMATGQPQTDIEVSGETPASPGVVRYWRENFFPISHGDEVLGVGAVVEEITKEKQVEAALEEQAVRLNRILDGTVGFVGILDLDGTLLEANAPALEVAGLTRDEVIGRKFWDTHWWSYDDQVIARLKDAVATARQGQSVRYDETVRVQDDRRITIDFMLAPIRNAEGQVVQLVPSAFDVSERYQALEHLHLLMREVNHRSKNMLALVQAIARQTAKSGSGDFLPRFSERVSALAAAQDLLVNGNWQSVEIEDLVRSQLAHFEGLLDTRILLRGPVCRVTAEAAQSLGLALHELATNAGKYGALSNDTGVVDIAWSLDGPNEPSPSLTISWSESGGPPVAEPETRGFGSTVTDQMVGTVLDAKVVIEFREAGLCWTLHRANCLV